MRPDGDLRFPVLKAHHEARPEMPSLSPISGVLLEIVINLQHVIQFFLLLIGGELVVEIDVGGCG